MSIVLAAVLFLMFARPVLPFLSKKQVIIPPTQLEGTLNTSSSVPRLDKTILISFDPFHRDVEASNIPAQMVTSALETTLNLKVFGMRADTKGDSSSAIIQTPDNQQASYILGQEIIPGVTLKQVDIDFVLLDRNGVIERLSRQGKAEGEQSVHTAIALVALAFKAQDMINDLRFYPQREGRNVIGYKMRTRRGGSVEKYGFKQNDVITAINGESLTQNGVNITNIMKNLKQARYASIQILRNDAPMTIEVNLQ